MHPHDEQSNDEQTLTPLAALQNKALRGAVVLFGGEVRRPKLARLKGQTGVAVEWTEGRDGARLAWRIRRGAVVAVVLLEGLVLHAQLDEVVRALRQRAVPHRYGGRGGIRRLLEALVDLDRQMRDRPS